MENSQLIQYILNSIDISSVVENKVDKVDGKELSSNDYTTLEKNKLASLENFSKDYLELTNKPYIPSITNLATKAELTTGLDTKANLSHLQEISSVINLQTALDNRYPKDETMSKEAIQILFNTVSKNMNWKEPIDTLANLQALTTMTEGDAHVVTSLSTIYVYSNNAWISLGSSASVPMATELVDGLLSKEDKIKLNAIIVANLVTNQQLADTLLSYIKTVDADAKYELKNTMLVKPTNYLYVGKNGNDSTGDGSASKPFLTVQKAIDTAISGTTIFIFPATYNENLTFKAGVYLTASVKYGVYITGNHICNYTGTTILENIVLNSSSGITLSFQGTNAQNFQLLGCSVDSTNGHAISWTNTNASSKIYSEDSITSVSASSSSAKAFFSPSTAKGSVVLNRYSIKINNPDNVSLDIGGSLSFTHTGDQIVGQILVNNSATATFSSLPNTTLSTPVLTTNSTGMTTMVNTVINTTASPAIAGVGAFSYVAVLYTNTGVGGASTLNGGLGAIALPMSSLKLRNSSLIPSGQIIAGYNNGAFEFDSNELYFTKNNARYKVVMGENNEKEKVDVLPTTNININKIYLLTTDKSINIYNGSTWDKYGGTASGGISTWNTFNL